MIKSLKYKPEAPMKWITQVENFTIRATFIVYFSLPQLSPTRSVMWKCHMSDSTEGQYDIIIGINILKTMGIEIIFSHNVKAYSEETYQGFT